MCIVLAIAYSYIFCTVPPETSATVHEAMPQGTTATSSSTSALQNQSVIPKKSKRSIWHGLIIPT